MKKLPLDKLAELIAGAGVPGLILLVAMAISGYAGAAALTTALAALGGPMGMIGGVGVLVLAGFISKGLASYGLEAIFKAVLKELKRRGETKDSLLKKVDGYWISKRLKLVVQDSINQMWLE